MLTADGAATCPSGDHVWNGHSPASTPNPTISNGNITRWKPTEYSIPSRTCRSNVPAFASTKIASSAIQIRTLPATRNSMSFIAPYSFVRMKSLNVELLPQTPISGYIGSTASS